MAAINKIAPNSPSRQNPSELETAIAGALFDLESNTQDLKASLRPLQFVSAREVRIVVRGSDMRIESFWNGVCEFSRDFRCSGVYWLDLWIDFNSYPPTPKIINMERNNQQRRQHANGYENSQSKTPFQEEFCFCVHTTLSTGQRSDIILLSRLRSATARRPSLSSSPSPS